jgi:WD40 repeat protein/DNA-binding SARP family transcriptional activator
VQFRVLGPLEVDAGDGPLPLGGPKQRAVLASLLVRANRVVPVDALIDDVWGEDAPDKARHILHTYVSSLRKSLGDGRLQGRPPGYLLVVEPAEFDADRFDALVSEANRSLPVDPKVAIATFDDALALWRGPALADVSEQPSMLAEAARLDELRTAAQEARIEALLATGAQAKALAELEPLLARDPLRESLWGLAMLANYRDGRQGEALNAFGRARELLADELGVDPSPELSKLHERILKQDPDLALRGEPLRGYRLLERIGSGRFGVVFRAVQPHVGRDVAVKLFHEQIAMDPGFVLRFERESQLVAALEHPHIVPLHDYWREPGRAYIVSRYMRGGSLRALLERGGHLDRERALRIVEQVASALAFAHRQGTAHGAVSPSNVLLDGESNAYLGDFRVGVGVTPDAEQDLRALAELTRELLGNEVPASLAEILDTRVGATDGPGAETIAGVARGVLEHRTVAPSRVPDERNPYKGLRAFTEADVGDFFGREELIQRLLTRLNGPVPGARFLAVVGPSGSGKSSVVRAGLVPALRRGGVPTSRQVLVADLFPGRHPLDELESAIVRVAARPPTRLGDLLRDGPRGLLEATDHIVPADMELVLVVDQFEELFTLTTDERERELTLEALRVAALDPSSRLRVIVTLRADHYDRPLTYPRFGELLATRNETIPPLTADELEQAIRKPAERQDTLLEPGLVAEMIADVTHQPGGLPLLQYALTELFERRDGDRLTLSAYREMGGVTGALTARADLLYTTSDAEGRRAIEQVFLRLVTLGEGRQDTRRRVALGELDALSVSETAVEAALEAYGRHRLLTFDHEPATRDPTVEIAHESLLGAWSRLASWIDAARDDIRQNDRLNRAAAEWQGSGRDRSFLMSGSRLDQVEGWAAATRFSVGQGERAYLKASMEHRDGARRQEQARRHHEASLERRSVRRLRGLVAVFAVAALVAGSLTIVATNRGTEAERQARIASARELVAASARFLDTDSDRGILLALEAIDLTRSVDGSVLPEAEEALHEAVAASRSVLAVPGVGGALSWSPKGVFVTEGPEGSGTIDIRDDSTGGSVLTIRAHDGGVTEMAFSPDGSMLATTGLDGHLKAWNPRSGELRWSISGEGKANSLSFSADGSRVAAGWPKEDLVRVADPRTGAVVRNLRNPVPKWMSDVTALSPDGSRIALGGDALVVIGLEAREVIEMDRPYWGVWGVSWSPNGKYIAAQIHAAISLFDARSGTRLNQLSGVDGEVEWSPNSRQLVAPAPSDGTAVVWSIQEHGTANETQTLLGGEMNSPIEGLAFSHDGNAVMASDEQTAVKVWSLEPRNFEWASFPNHPIYWSDVEFMPDGKRVATNAYGKGGFVKILDVASGRLVRTLGHEEDQGHAKETSFDVSPGGDLVAIMSGNEMRVWSVTTGEEVLPMRLDGVVSGGWNPDGDLIVAGGTDGLARIIDRSGSVVQTLSTGWDEGVHDARFSPDGRLVATTRNTEETLVWDWDRGEVISRIPDDGPWEIAFDRTGSRIASANALWDSETGEQVMALPPLDLYAGRVAFSPDGSRFARGSFRGGVTLFDAQTGEQLFTLDGECAVAGIDFSPDGSRLVTVDGCYTMKVWAHDIDDLLDLARQRVTRALTHEECRQYLHVDRCAE